jgi:urea transport system permease protein
MTPLIRIARVLAALVPLALAALPAQADEERIREITAKFATADGFDAVEAVIRELGETGDPDAVRPLKALQEGDLKIREDTREVVIEAEDASGEDQLLDPITGEVIATAAQVEAQDIDLDRIRTKNSIRRMIGDVVSALTLGAPDPAVRLSAADTLFENADEDQLEAIEAALEAETVPEVRARMEQARAAVLLEEPGDHDAETLLAAVDTIAARGDQQALAVLASFANDAEGEIAEAARDGVAAIESRLQAWEAAQNVWYGLSLGSVLFLAAIGLAITFGVMGVINMAHGEMVMLGAYTTFAVQEAIRGSAPWLFEYSLLISLPLAFGVAGGVGLLMERGIIRHLYGRPLETLLATWGVSLILQQAVRTIFGPNNREVGNPDWMSGAFQLGELSITWSRLWIVVFALVVFAVLLIALNRTSLGLQMRAVTQNRRMASAMGIRTPWVDAMTFALGSGIAGIAGVALSQIDNVSPNLGQSYIVDSFMVVVFGGVGNLWGTLIGGLTLGVANKFLEPYAGAVLGKILILVFIILFIQRRPRGLFALRGRAADA